jgi:3-hydroxyacyl-[acyl-carrier-protein] dehydratase
MAIRLLDQQRVPALLDLLPHRPPWLLVDRVLSVEETRIVAEKRLAADDPLLGAGGLGGPLAIEAVAQAAACLMGQGAVGEREHHGYLVAARGWKFPGWAHAGETVTLRAERLGSFGSLYAFRGEASVDGRPIAVGELRFGVSLSQPAADQ